MLPEQIQAVIDDLVRFHCQTIKMDQVYLVVLPGGSARFNYLQMTAGKSCNVISTRNEPIPVRDHHIYVVAQGPQPKQGELTVVIADLLHTKMCGVGKKGADITLGEIHAAARAEVLARLTDAGASVDRTDSPDLVVGVLGEAVNEGTTDPAAKEPLPATAVQIVVGDTVMSEPFRTPEAAEVSSQYEALKLLPEVVSGTKMIWLRPLDPA
jgi:hypothetical protein